jgi:hypothetical protein
MSHALRRDELLDRLHTDWTLLLDSEGYTTVEVIAKHRSALLNEAAKLVVPEGRDGLLDPEQVIEQALRICCDLIAAVNQTEGLGAEFVSRKEIEELAAVGSPTAIELSTRAAEMHRWLERWEKNPVRGDEFARTIGDLARSLTCSLDPSDESDTHIVPLQGGLAGKTLRVTGPDGFQGLCEALGLDARQIDSVSDHDRVSFFLKQLQNYRDDVPENKARAKRLSELLYDTLREMRLYIVGPANPPGPFAWKPVFEGLIKSNRALLATYVASEVTPQSIARFFNAESQNDEGNFAWSSTRVPFIAVGTAPDGSLVGLFGCSTWT